MFVWDRSGIGEDHRLSGGSCAKGYRPPLDKGGLPVSGADGKHLLTILAGPSPYRTYIAPAIATGAVPVDFFRIVTDVGTQVPKHLRDVFRAGDGTFVGGTIDRWTRTIYAVPAPGLRAETRLEYALHEAVHLFGHPHSPQAGSCAALCVGTFQRTYGTGFGEGATQVIAEDIMDCQQITRYYRARPYEKFTPPVRKLIDVFSLDAVARAYFWGETAALTAAMEWRWGGMWRAVAALTTAKETTKALNLIDKLEREHVDRMKKGPKGDFPVPDRFRRYA
ncbi:MAG: hypothetical protein ABW221_22620 [Vicinamibacteria bacterium]